VAIYICINYFCIVPTPSAVIDTPNIQTVGESFTMKCLATSVRGITSRLDIVWTSNGVELRKTEGVIVNSTTTKSMLFIDYYTISQLSTSDEGRALQCEVVINANVTITTTKFITLNVNGECIANSVYNL